MREQLFADIIVNISHEKLDRTFQYRVPEQLAELIHVGSVVEVPFGGGDRPTKGYVLGLSDKAKIEAAKVKDINAVLTDSRLVSGEDALVLLAAWMREMYGTTMIQALKTVLPVKQKIKQKERKIIRLLLDEEELSAKIDFFRKKNQKARLRLLEALASEGSIPYEIVMGKLNISSATVKAMEKQEIVSCESFQVYRNPLHVTDKKGSSVTLNEQQLRAVKAIRENWGDPDKRVSLLYGITGSGKTEVYMELIAHAVERGQQAIVLIPEIALTYQTVMRFYKRFGERISVIHSKLSPGERYDQFLRAREGDIDVMIGPRSALFTPFPNLGIIIIDEEHEPTYQSESAPRYHARETAIRRAQIEDAMVVLGSATPSLESYSRALSGEYQLYRLSKRAKEESILPTAYIADMRREMRAGNRSIVGKLLEEKIQDRLDKGQQIMLFLNRRGYAGFVSCRECGHVIKCPHCDVSLSLHGNGKMICHYCGYQEPKPARCPKCGSEFISGFGIGTQQAVEMVQKKFPKARILRMDMDTTREKEGHQKILSAFEGREADILVGTQMIVKGHDFPNVTLVGILAADLSLYAQDFRAVERTFQLLTQAAGRAGRGSFAGEVVIQTYDPQHYCIRAAAAQDYEAFYNEEMIYRKVAGYPPVKKMMSIHGTCRQEEHLQIAMEYLKKIILRILGEQKAQVIGPAEESISKIQDVYRKVIYVKADNLGQLTGIQHKLEQYMEMNEGYRTVNIQFEME